MFEISFRNAGPLLSTCILWMAAPCGAKPSQPEPIAQEMQARIQKLAPEVTLSVPDPRTLHVENGPQAGGRISLDRVAAFCQRNDAALCEEQKQKFAAGIASSLVTVDYSITPARLRVIVRNDEYVAGATAELGRGKSGPLITAPFVAGLNLVLAADFPQTTRLVNEGDIKALGLTREDAIALGTNQVLAELPPLPDAGTLSSSVIAISGNDYGASYLMAADQWSALAKSVQGVLWIAVPADERVVVGVAKSEKDLEKLKAIVAQDYATAPRGISPLIYRWTGGKWLPLD